MVIFSCRPEGLWKNLQLGVPRPSVVDVLQRGPGSAAR
jgi:hypothetical protein